MHDEKELRWFDRVGVARPTHEPHGTIDDIRAQLKQAKCHNWHMVGNVLHADSDFGPFTQTLPTDVICKGTDKNGLPILTRIEL